MKFKTVKMIDCSDFDKLVQETYGRVYKFQQQDDCKSRGVEHFTVPAPASDYENDTIPEEVNGPEMGVSFKAWLERDPEQKLTGRYDQNDFSLKLWWGRNFYPDPQMVLNDLHEKGLIEAGEYSIDIDW